MNTKKLIFAISVLAVGLMGCEPLDQYPDNKFTDGNYWTSPERAQLMLNMAYSQMYSADKLWDDEALSDNLVNVRDIGASQMLVRRGQAMAATALFKDEWSWAYGGVKTCNVFLKNIGSVPNMPADQLKRMTAEIRFVRAWLYFRLSNFYGAIPFFLEDIDVASSKSIARTARTEVLATLHSELEAIIPDLPKKEQLTADERGKITKAAAVMLNARIYLAEKNWPKVEAECSKLINEQDTYGQYELSTKVTNANYTAYDCLFFAENEYNSEVILDYGYVVEDKTWNRYLDMTPIQAEPETRVSTLNPTQSLADAFIKLDGTPVKTRYTKPEPYTATDIDAQNLATQMAGRDPRLYSTIAYPGGIWKGANSNPSTNFTLTTTDIGGNYSGTGYYCRKLFDPNRQSAMRLNNNIIMMRYADVLLMYAEAKMEQGTCDAAVWDATIKPIRQRAGFSVASALDFPGETNLREILHRERRCELALEGLRYLDLLRWDGNPVGDGASVMLNGMVYGAKLKDSGTDYVNAADYKYTKGRDELWSVPIHDIEQTPTLKPNNPGYDI